MNKPKRWTYEEYRKKYVTRSMAHLNSEGGIKLWIEINESYMDYLEAKVKELKRQSLGIYESGTISPSRMSIPSISREIEKRWKRLQDEVNKEIASYLKTDKEK